MNGEAPALDSISFPVDARVLNGSRHEIGHNVRNACLATEAVEEGEFSLHLGGLIRGPGRRQIIAGLGFCCLLAPFSPVPSPEPVSCSFLAIL